jgi:hypothetical protein
MSRAGKKLVKSAKQARDISAHCKVINDAFRQFLSAVGDRNAREWLYGALTRLQQQDPDFRRLDRKRAREEKAEAAPTGGLGA